MKKDDAWAWMTVCSDKDGRRITQFEVMEGPQRGTKYFKGQVSLKMRVSPDPRVPPQKMPFEFDFPNGKNLRWCKNHFDEQAEQSIEQWKEDQQKAQQEKQNQIVPAKGVPPMLGPDGKPMKPQG